MYTKFIDALIVKFYLYQLRNILYILYSDLKFISL